MRHPRLAHTGGCSQGRIEDEHGVAMPERIDPPKEEKRGLSSIEKSMLESEIAEQIRTVFDPEIPVNVYDLGLIYDIIIDDDKNAHIVMTLTSPMCPVAETLPGEVE